MASNKKTAAKAGARTVGARTAGAHAAGGTRRTRATRAAHAKRAATQPVGTGPAGAHVVLGPALTIAEVAGCARGFAAMLAGGTAQADARALESIDTAGLQLLLAAAAAAQQRGLKLTLRGAPELLTGAADALGVGGELSAAVELSA